MILSQFDIGVQPELGFAGRMPNVNMEPDFLSGVEMDPKSSSWGSWGEPNLRPKLSVQQTKKSARRSGRFFIRTGGLAAPAFGIRKGDVAGLDRAHIAIAGLAELVTPVVRQPTCPERPFTTETFARE